MIMNWTKRLIEKLTRKGYRQAYVAEHVRTGIAYQIRALRDERGWSQKLLAEKLDKPQSVVSRLEDPDYGKLSVATLLEVAATYDVALVIRYVSFPEFLRHYDDVTPRALGAPSFSVQQFQPIAAVRWAADNRMRHRYSASASAPRSWSLVTANQPIAKSPPLPVNAPTSTP